MPYRVVPLVTDNYYHILNRGVAHQPTFSVTKDYERFLFSLVYYRHQAPPFRLARLFQLSKDERQTILKGLEETQKTIVELIAYCFMPNHFHLLVKQTSDGGISQFMKKVSDSYTRYYNTKHGRIGPVFQGAFKAIHINSEEQLLHVSRYIHLNPLVSVVVSEKNFINYPWSSLRHYVNEEASSFLNIRPILHHFRSSEKHIEFIMDRADYGRRLQEIKHLTLEK